MKIAKSKIMLYICYNDIVRNNVSSLCVTHNVDIKFWIATTDRININRIYILLILDPIKIVIQIGVKINLQN